VAGRPKRGHVNVLSRDIQHRRECRLQEPQCPRSISNNTAVECYSNSVRVVFYRDRMIGAWNLHRSLLLMPGQTLATSLH
jgi:hypothetical protein